MDRRPLIDPVLGNIKRRTRNEATPKFFARRVVLKGLMVFEKLEIDLRASGAPEHAQDRQRTLTPRLPLVTQLFVILASQPTSLEDVRIGLTIHLDTIVRWQLPVWIVRA